MQKIKDLMKKFSEKGESVILHLILASLDLIFLDQQEFRKNQIYNTFAHSRFSSFMQKVKKHCTKNEVSH